MAAVLGIYGKPEVNSNDYIMDPANKVTGLRQGGRGNSSNILKYADGSEWVVLMKNPIERFCGFLYLQEALSELNVGKIEAANNKIAIHRKEIIYLSKYHGDNKLDIMDTYSRHDELLVVEHDAKFNDIIAGTNLRKQEGVVYIFDTEKSSFDQSVHQKINSFMDQHNRIRSIVEKFLEP